MLQSPAEPAVKINLYKADTIHDVGLTGLVEAQDLSKCRIALGDMMFECKEPTEQNDI